MTKDEYTKLRLILAQRFASADTMSAYIDCTSEDMRKTPGWRPYGRMDAALDDADALLRAADVSVDEEVA